jgi:hypothetical protein
MFRAVAVTACCDGNIPRRSGTKERSSANRKAQNDGGPTSSRNIFFCLRDDLVDATFGFGWRQSSKRRD